MSLEEALKANTTAVEALTAALAKSAGKGSTTSAGDGAKGGDATKTEKVAKGKHTKAEVVALMTQVKEKFDTKTAVALRNTHGKVEKMDLLTDPAAIDALFDACTAKLAEGDEGGEEGGDGL